MAITYIDELLATTDILDLTRETKSLPTSLESDIWIVQVSYDTYTNGTYAIGSWFAANGWTTIVANDATAPAHVLVVKRMGVSPDTEVQIERSNDGEGRGNVIGQLFRGADTTTMFDVTETLATGGSNDPDNPSITPSTDGCMIVIVAAGDDDTGTLTTTPSGFSNTTFQSTAGGATTAGDTAAAFASQLQATAALIDPAVWVWADFDDAWRAYTIALRPAFDKAGVDSFTLTESAMLLQDYTATDSISLSGEVAVQEVLVTKAAVDAATLTEVAVQAEVELNLTGVDAATLAEVAELAQRAAQIDLTGSAFLVRMPTSDSMHTLVDRFVARFDYRYIGYVVLCTETSPGVWDVTPYPGTLDLTADNTTAADVIFYGGRGVVDLDDAALADALVAAGYPVS